MRDYARDLIASAVSFMRGHGGSSGANAPVGAAFVIGALLVAVLGLRWISTTGTERDGTDQTPWEFAEAGNVNPSTTIPASDPAKVVPIHDPDAGPGPDTTTTTVPGQRPGVFLPGFSPEPGGGQGPTTTRNGTTPTTKPGGGPTTTKPGATTTDPPVTTTDPPVTTTDPPVTTTDPPVTTTDPPPTTEDTTPPEDLGDEAQDRISQRFDELGWPFS